jgi:hypothetical protein
VQYFKTNFSPPTNFLIFAESNFFFEIGTPLCLPGSAEAASVNTIMEITEVNIIKKIRVS